MQNMMSNWVVLYLAVWISFLNFGSFSPTVLNDGNGVDWSVPKVFTSDGHRDAMYIRDAFYPLMYNGKSEELLELFLRIHSKFGTLYVDDEYPNLYNLQGVLFFYLNRRKDAFLAFRRAVEINKEDLRALVNLVDVGRSFQQHIEESSRLVEELTGREDRHKKANEANWMSLEMDQFQDINNIRRCVYEHRDEDICDLELINVNILYFHPTLWRDYLEFSANNAQKDLEKYCQSSAVELQQPALQPLSWANKSQVYIGILLVTNDLNPVNILSYSLIKHLPRNRIKLFGFFLNAAESEILLDWQQDLTKSFDIVVHLDGMDRFGAFHLIHEIHQIDILIEMNGMSLNSGSAILIHRPAPIQMSFLGDPITSGLPYIDFFIGDPQSIAVDHMVNGFSEKLLLLPTCYLANSHQLSQKHIPGRGRIPRGSFVRHLGYPTKRLVDYKSSVDLGDTDLTDGTRIHSEAEPLILGAFHGWSKIDPIIFQVWMNILHSSPRDVLLLQTVKTGEYGKLRSQMHYYGIDPKVRASYLHLTPFSEHLYVKSAIDLYLDTILKNGHTTTMDAHWAGLPTIALGGRDTMLSRSSQSAAFYNDNDFGVVFSLKEYEDLVVTLIKSKKGRILLNAWRRYCERQRLEGKLFDGQVYAKEFGYLMEAVFELYRLKITKTHRILQDNSDILSREYHFYAVDRQL